MNDIQKKFIYLSQLIKIPVIDVANSKKIGYVADIAVSLKEIYPRASCLIVAIGFKKKICIPFQQIRKMQEEKAIFVENSSAFLNNEAELSGSDILLKETFWDKQIVDIAGSKVVRVNDLHLLREELSLWVVHVDVGITGIIRRLGWIKFLNFTTKLISSYQIEDQLIPWKFVQPIKSGVNLETLALKAHHSKLAELHPAELADILIDLGTNERVSILKSLDNATAAHTFQELPIKVRVQVAESLDKDRLVNIINEMAMDELADLLAELPKKKKSSILGRLPQEKALQVSSLLMHSQRTAGSIMNTEYVSVKQSVTAAMVLDRIKNELKKKETVYYIYVVDDMDILVGVVTLDQVLKAQPEKIVSEFMRRRVNKVKVTTDVHDVAEVFYKYDFTVVPVVDKQNKLQGIITIKDAFKSVFKQIKQESEEPS